MQLPRWLVTTISALGFVFGVHEVAREDLPGGGSAWVRQDEGRSTLYVAVPGKPTTRWSLPAAADLGQPTLLVGSSLAVRGEAGYLATVDWRRGQLTAGGSTRIGPDGLVDRWGR